MDNGMEIVLRGAEVAGCTENVKLTASVKWTSGRINEFCGTDGGVVRMMLTDENDRLTMEQFGDKEYPIHTPESIADFIVWSKAQAPADNYILILAGHGNGWHPGVGLTATRGTVRDTDLDRYIGLEELNAGIALSNTHFKLINFNSCLMNVMEYHTELMDDADYILAPSHVSILLGSELAYLLTSLEAITERGNAAFLAAMETYIEDIAGQMIFYSEEGAPLDLIFTDTSRIAALNESIRLFTNEVIKLYDEEAEIGAEAMAAKYGATITDLEAEIGDAYNFLWEHQAGGEIDENSYMRQSFTCDIVDIAARAARALHTPELEAAATLIKERARDARIKSYTQDMRIEDIYYGVTLTNSTEWEAKEYEAAGYCSTLFDTTTGWSRLLRRNNITLRY